MINRSLFPPVDPQHIHTVVKEYHGAVEVVDLDNGETLRLLGDGRGRAEDGTIYVAVSRGLAEPYEDGSFDRYELLGYADINDTEA